MKWIVLGLLAVGSSACTSGADCSVDTDCFQGEFCDDGTCALGTSVANNVNNVTANNATANNAAANNANNAANNANNTANNSASNNANNTTNPDAGMPDMPMLGTCEVDRLTSSCTDDEFEPNNSWIDGERLTSSYPGCPTTSTFVPYDRTLQATKCARDSEDWYFIDFYPCVDNDIEIRWTLTFDDACMSDTFDFSSLSFDCGSEATCTQQAGGGTVSIIVPKTGLRQSQLSYVSLKALSDKLQASYNLRIEVIQR